MLDLLEILESLSITCHIKSSTKGIALVKGISPAKQGLTLSYFYKQLPFPFLTLRLEEVTTDTYDYATIYYSREN